MCQTVGYSIFLSLFVISTLVAVPTSKHELDVETENSTQQNCGPEVLQPPVELIINTTKVCSPTTQLLITVHTGVGNFGRRRTIRETYGQGEWRHKFNFNVLFVVGTLEDEHNLFGKWLIEESEEFQDIIQGDFVDDYSNLTTKVLMWMRYVENNCLRTTHVIHLDDDIAIDLFSIMHAYYTERMFKENAVYCLADAYIGARTIRDKKSKWFVPESLYPEPYYPVYCAGAAYILPTRIMKMLISDMETRKYIQVDDALVTGITRDALKVDILKVEPTAILRATPDNVVDSFYEKRVIVGECASDHCSTRVWDHVISEYRTSSAPRYKIILTTIEQRKPKFFSFSYDLMFVLSFLFILFVATKILRRKHVQPPCPEHKINLL